MELASSSGYQAVGFSYDQPTSGDNTAATGKNASGMCLKHTNVLLF